MVVAAAVPSYIQAHTPLLHELAHFSHRHHICSIFFLSSLYVEGKLGSHNIDLCGFLPQLLPPSLYIPSEIRHAGRSLAPPISSS